MTNDSGLTRGDWLTQLRALAPSVEKWREVAEHERRLPRELFELLREAHVFALSSPRAFGGAEADESTAVEVIEELSRQDGAVGWNAMVASNTATITSYLSRSALEDVYRSGPSTVVAGALLPKGMAVPVADGYRLTGRWTLASGCHQADWLVACSTVVVDGKPRMRADGRPDVRTLHLPMAQCLIHDTWYTAGLRGTGSHDCEVRDVVVPEARTTSILFDGPREPGALYVKDFGAFAVARVAAVALGIARDAVESFVTLAEKKTPTVATTTLANQHTVHERVGRAEGLLRSGRALLYETVRALPYTPTWSEPLDDEQRASIRLAGALAAEHAATAVDLMFNAAGTSAIYATSRLERCFRDVHVATQHINVAPSNIEMVGQYMLGLGLKFRR
jgi:alkylation response protein AidB-like acyl-CoA dehydrogenase